MKIINAEQRLAALKVQISDMGTAIRQGTGNIDAHREQLEEMKPSTRR